MALNQAELFGDRPLSRPPELLQVASEPYLVEACEDRTIAKPRILLVVIAQPPEGTVGVAHRFDDPAYLPASPQSGLRWHTTRTMA